MLTRRCCYCTPKHIIGEDHGAPYTDGLCRWAYYKETTRFYWKIWSKRITAILTLTGALVIAIGASHFFTHLLIWAWFGFPIAK